MSCWGCPLLTSVLSNGYAALIGIALCFEVEHFGLFDFVAMVVGTHGEA